MPTPDSGENGSSKLFAPVILAVLLIAGVIRFATEVSDKTGSAATPTPTSIVRDKDKQAAKEALKADDVARNTSPAGQSTPKLEAPRATVSAGGPVIASSFSTPPQAIRPELERSLKQLGEGEELSSDCTELTDGMFCGLYGDHFDGFVRGDKSISEIEIQSRYVGGNELGRCIILSNFAKTVAAVMITFDPQLSSAEASGVLDKLTSEYLARREGTALGRSTVYTLKQKDGTLAFSASPRPNGPAEQSSPDSVLTPDAFAPAMAKFVAGLDRAGIVDDVDVGLSAAAVAEIKKAKEELRQLYTELLSFRDRADFHLVGFSERYRYNDWLGRASRFALRDDKEIQWALARFAPAKVALLELAYDWMKNKGRDSKNTFAQIKDVERALAEE
jgi:hypothetical protein